MAKKIKRKVSQVGAGAVRGSDAVAEAPEMAVATSSSAASAAPRSFGRKAATSVTEFNPDYTYVVKDLKRIGILAGSFFTLLIVLSIVLPLVLKQVKHLASHLDHSRQVLTIERCQI